MDGFSGIKYAEKILSINEMIYLILTTSLSSQQASAHQEDREKRYQTAIQETLQWVPPTIQPLIVENNGERPTVLEHFQHAGKIVPVYYTINNRKHYTHKGVNELLDLKAVIDTVGMSDKDIVIKLTGRYRMLSSRFLEQVMAEQHSYDAWIKFFGSCSLRYEYSDCILGCYGMRVSHLRWLSWSWMNMIASPEVAMAKYVRTAVSAERICEVTALEVECVFSEDGRVLVV